MAAERRSLPAIFSAVRVRDETRHHEVVHGPAATLKPRGSRLLSERELIFISIASYRDPQLTPTIADCLRKASAPERLRFGICWQRGPEEAPLEFAGDPRFRVLEVDWRHSKGACWARAEVMKLWAGEAWFLQVDSHCRFAHGWDDLLLHEISVTRAAMSSEKPILSTYAAPFTPGGEEVLTDATMQMVFQGFDYDGIPRLKPEPFLPLRAPDGSALPRRARFLAAGFLFAEGRFVEEVPYDPELYFMGEESAMTVRAFTHGYDIFHPAKTVVWHDYIRSDAKKHWGDHTEANSVPQTWNALEERSRSKVKRLLLGKPVESFGLGSVRTLEEYEAYAGLSFRMHKAQRYTVLGEQPPNPEPPPGWAGAIFPWIARIRVKRSELPEGALEDPAIWCAAIQDGARVDVWRSDLAAELLAPLQGEQEELEVICEFSSETVPVGWTIWPVSRSRGWLKKIHGLLGEGDYAVLAEEDES